MRGLIRRWGEGSHSHSHSHAADGGAASPVTTSRPIVWVAFALLFAVAVATVAGMFALQPDSGSTASLSERAEYLAPGATLEQGQILGVEERCENDGSGAAVEGPAGETSGGETSASRCLRLSIGLRSGPDEGRMVTIDARGAAASAGLREGDRVELIAFPMPAAPTFDAPETGETPGEGSAEASAEGSAPGAGVAPEDAAAAGAAAGAESGAGEAVPGTAAEAAQRGYALEGDGADARGYEVSGVMRGWPLALLTLVFALVVIWVGRVRGLLALVALVIAAGVLLLFVLPALVSGGPGIPIGLVGSSAIMFVILYLVHGPSLRTTAALVGTLFGILIMTLVSMIAVSTTRLSGIGDESAGLLASMTAQIDFRGLLSCAIIIAGLGVLNDVTITQASAVWELRSAAPGMPRREVYERAMRIGRDHIASTVYTVFFAYVGAALSVLLVLFIYDRSVLSLLTREDIAIEIVRTLCGSIGLVLAVPVTTAVAALFLPAEERVRAA